MSVAILTHDPGYSLVVHLHTAALELRRNSAIAIATTVLEIHLLNGRTHLGFLFAGHVCF